MKGRKRHLAVDSLGLLVRLIVHPANLQDRVGIGLLLRRIPLYDRWARVLVDGGYASDANAVRCRLWYGIDYQVVPRPPGPDFVPEPLRWKVERTLAWFGRYRRLSKDYEQVPLVSETFPYVAMIHLLARRLARYSG